MAARGRPRYEPTAKDRATVKAMTAYGIKQEDVARVIGINAETMRIHFRDELDTAMAEANAKVAQALFKQATEHGSVAAMCFWLKTRAKWRETESEQNAEQTIVIKGGLPD